MQEDRQMKLLNILAIFFLLFWKIGSVYSAPPEATLIIKYPYTNYSVGIRDTASVKINDGEPIILEPTWGAGDTAQTTVRVPSGALKIESSHWKREDANFINRVEIQGGKTYTVVLYTMGFQMWDAIFSASQDMLLKNQQQPKEKYSDHTIKNQIISIQ
jgi:hypothetical protein